MVRKTIPTVLPVLTFSLETFELFYSPACRQEPLLDLCGGRNNPDRMRRFGPDPKDESLPGACVRANRVFDTR